MWRQLYVARERQHELRRVRHGLQSWPDLLEGRVRCFVRRRHHAVRRHLQRHASRPEELRRVRYFVQTGRGLLGWQVRLGLHDGSDDLRQLLRERADRQRQLRRVRNDLRGRPSVQRR